MKRTDEMLAYSDVLAAELVATGGDRAYRLVADKEGFPAVKGRYGQVEYYGPEAGRAPRAGRLRVWTDRRGVIPRLRALEGLHPQQVGDSEARFWFLAGEPEVLKAVCRVIKARVRRAGGRSAEAMAQMRGRKKGR